MESLPKKPPPTPPKGGKTSLEVFCRNYLRKCQESLSSRVRIGTPLLSEGLGEAFFSEGLGEAFLLVNAKTVFVYYADY